MYKKVQTILAQLPPHDTEPLLPEIRDAFARSGKTLVVLDDDPTGTQTCYDVTVLTAWHVPLLASELSKNPAVLFILTNSRSLPEAEAVALTRAICANLLQACAGSHREVTVISRSDSTLRGHFPAEVDAAADALGIGDAVRVLIPAFIEGGRYTIDDVHYLVEEDRLVPVSDTPFSRDVVFGYTHANLRAWVEEKTGGRIAAASVISFSLEDLRAGGQYVVCEMLKQCSPGATCVVNAVSFRDLEVFALGALLAEQAGRKLLYRSSATFVPLRAGFPSGKIFHPRRAATGTGSLVVVGSHVPKTTGQLTWLLTQGVFRSLEADVSLILETRTPEALAAGYIRQIDRWLTEGHDVVVHTSRALQTGHDAQSSLKINATVSDFLVAVVRGLSVRPAFIIGKGGITSSDLASRGLSSEKALILGQVIPGVPVWQLDQGSKFPDITFVVFPGNVGDHTALAAVHKKLKA